MAPRKSILQPNRAGLPVHELTSSIKFTISSAPEDPFISVHIRQVGDFTQALGARLGATETAQAILNENKDSKRESWSSYDSVDGYKHGRRGEFVEIVPGLGKSMPKLKIDGPYGAPAEDVFKSEVAVLVAAGIGVTVSPHPPVFPPLFWARLSAGIAIREHPEAHLVCPKGGQTRQAEAGRIHLVLSRYRSVRLSSYE